jgi:DNA repair photolyase
MMSTATDPYVPQEAELRVTRSLLEVFARHPRHKLSILTKSTLFLDDLDLLARVGRLSLGCSVSTFRDALAAKIEPWGALPSERVAALARAAEAGIHTVVLWAPMLVPVRSTEADYEALLAPIRDLGIAAVKTDTANYRGTFSRAVLATIAAEGERFADERDEAAVAEVRRRLDLDRKSPALDEGDEQPSLFDDL